MASMTEITCKCGCSRKRMVRTADVRRGWGKFYDKSCKARFQSKSGGSADYYRYKKYQREFGGNPQFSRSGEYEGFTLSASDMAEGNVQ